MVSPLRTATAFLLIGSWASILLSSFLTSVGLSPVQVVAVGAVTAALLIYVARTGNIDRFLGGIRNPWQTALVFLSVVLVSGVGVVYAVTLVYAVLVGTPSEWFPVLSAFAFVFVPIALSAWYVTQVERDRFEIPAPIRITEWNRRADAWLVLVASVAALAYGFDAFSPRSPAFVPLFNVGAMLFGLLHVVIRRSNVLDLEAETTS